MADMDRKTARKYRDNQGLSSDPKPDRSQRTRPDPFEADWPETLATLPKAPALEATTLFEDLIKRRPGIYQENQPRTLQRRVRDSATGAPSTFPSRKRTSPRSTGPVRSCRPTSRGATR